MMYLIRTMTRNSGGEWISEGIFEEDRAKSFTLDFFKRYRPDFETNSLRVFSLPSSTFVPRRVYAYISGDSVDFEETTRVPVF